MTSKNFKMEDDLKNFKMEDELKNFKMEDELKNVKMEDDLKNVKMEDDLKWQPNSKPPPQKKFLTKFSKLDFEPILKKRLSTEQ